jgi:hypothetical protein
MHGFARILVMVTAGPCACAAVSGLDSYTSSPGEGVNAGEAGSPDESSDGAGGPEDNGTNADTGGASNEGEVVGDGSLDTGGMCANACTGGATCQDGACLGGRPDAESEAGQDAGCTNVDLPPSVNVDAAQWSFTTSPIWNCATSATTTITANTGGASISGDNCGGSATLGDISNNYAQTTGGSNVLVIRLKSLTVTGSHIIQLAGDEPVIFLVNGNVTIDSGGKIDASANGSTAGPGGDGNACGTSTGTDSTVTTTGGGGGSFGTAGGYGATSSGSNGSAAGAVAASLALQPLRGGCAGGSGGDGTDNPGGAGGGAFEISASGTISVGATSTAFLSAAGGYSPGASISVESNGSGGAGSGGGVLLASPATATFANSSVVRVHGGGSGSGRGLSSTSNAGSNGSTTTDTPAAGGAAPDVGSAAGASGGLCAGTGTTCSTSATGSNGTATMLALPEGSGGGGGGGSVHVIAAPATVSCELN